MEDLIKSIDCQQIEIITGENQKTIKQWKKGTKNVPESAIRLLKFFFNGDAVYLAIAVNIVGQIDFKIGV